MTTDRSPPTSATGAAAGPTASSEGATTRIRGSVHRHQLGSFLVLAFGWTLACDAVVYLFVTTSPGVIPPWTAPRAWGPLIAAVLVTWLSGGSVRSFFGSLLDWRIEPRWFIAALAIPLVAFEASAVFAGLSGASLTFPANPWWTYVGGFVIVFFFAGSLEEFGWRGFVQPRLQERYSAATAAVVIGIVWAVWHLPLFVVFDMAAYETSTFLTAYLPALVAQSLVFAWLFNASGGSVLPVMVIHAAGNMPALVGYSGEVSGPAAPLVGNASLVVLYGIAALLALVYGTKYLAPRAPDPLIPGRPG